MGPMSRMRLRRQALTQLVLAIVWLLLGVAWLRRGSTGFGVAGLLLGLGMLLLSGLAAWRSRTAE